VKRTRAFFRSKRGAIAAASDEDLFSMTQIATDLQSQLRQEDVGACAAFASGMIGGEVQLTGTSNIMAGELAAQMVRMAASGERAPVRRDLAALRPADANALVRLLRKDGMSGRQLDLVTSDSLAGASAEEACEISIRLHRAIGGLPVDQGARIEAYILASPAR